VGSKWDNAFYTSAIVYDCKVNILVDSGSTASILSNITFERRNAEKILQPDPHRLSDVSGNEILTYDLSCLPVTMRSQIYQQRFIVCNLHQGDLSGQDFLLENIQKINYESLVSHTKDHNEIQYWVGG
jgi:hypothetical protein